MISHSYRNKYPDVVVGSRYGKLVVLAPAAPKTTGKQVYWQWLCQCDCGSEVIVRDAQLKRGTHSCGCLRGGDKEAARQRATRHGEGANGKETPEYISWVSMRRRITCPSISKYWCQRGVRICARWSRYENFLADMGRKPTPEHSIDRKNNNGHYSCGTCAECKAEGWTSNCRWATQLEQSQNQRRGNRWHKAIDSSVI